LGVSVVPLFLFFLDLRYDFPLALFCCVVSDTSVHYVIFQFSEAFGKFYGSQSKSTTANDASDSRGGVHDNSIT